MDSIGFRVGDRIFQLPRAKLPVDSYLLSLIQTSMQVERDQHVILISEDQEDIPDFEAVVRFLLEGTFPAWDQLATFGYLGLDPRQRYDLTLTLEEDMRSKMYQPEYQQHPMNTDPHYGLIELTEELWDRLVIQRPIDQNLLFAHQPPQKQSWFEIHMSLQTLSPFFSIPGLFVAGGRIFSALFGTPSSDVDLFFHGTQDPAEAEQRLFQILDLFIPEYEMWSHHRRMLELSLGFDLNDVKPKLDHLQSFYHSHCSKLPRGQHRETIKSTTLFMAQMLGFEAKIVDKVDRSSQHYVQLDNSILVLTPLTQEERRRAIHKLALKTRDLRVTRTKNAVSFRCGLKREYQAILRLYRTPSEILHGFDVDSCCLGWDGQRIWMTQRALYSICNGLNTVNFDRLSPSYERRLAKYGTRGMAIQVPNFTRDRIDRVALEQKYQDSIKETPYREFDILTQQMVHQGVHVGTDYRSLQDPRRDPLRGLDTLLYLEFQLKKRRYHKHTIKAIRNMAAEASDYSAIPFRKQSGTRLEWILEYLRDSQDEYPEQAEKYMPLLTEVMAWRETQAYVGQDALKFNINNVPISAQVDFVRMELHQTERYASSAHTIFRDLLHLPKLPFDCLATIRPVILPCELEWKVLRPGEQMTGTFHRTVLEDPAVWYQGRFYH